MASSSDRNLTQEFSRILLIWYSINARSLPWRGQSDAYAVWVSEIMLQQTRVETVIPYFLHWMDTFPTVQALANSDEHQVLNSWEGLGYYSRARGMLKAARLICEKHTGKLPSTAVELMTLPGIGRYTAAAISSIAFGADEAVLDGNVKRVLARVFHFKQPVNTPDGEKQLWQLADQLLPHGKAGDYNQAVMDLGATVCTPKSPRCESCPVKLQCEANKLGLQTKLPVMLEKPPVPHLTVCAAIIHKNDQVLIARRPSKGLLGGMWEFPGGKLEQGESFEQALAREIREELAADITVHSHLGVYHHAYTHFKVTLNAYHASLAGAEPLAVEASEIRWVNINELVNFPMGKIDRRISEDLLKNLES